MRWAAIVASTFISRRGEGARRQTLHLKFSLCTIFRIRPVCPHDRTSFRGLDHNVARCTARRRLCSLRCRRFCRHGLKSHKQSYAGHVPYQSPSNQCSKPLRRAPSDLVPRPLQLHPHIRHHHHHPRPHRPRHQSGPGVDRPSSSE